MASNPFTNSDYVKKMQEPLPSDIIVEYAARAGTKCFASQRSIPKGALRIGSYELTNNEKTSSKPWWYLYDEFIKDAAKVSLAKQTRVFGLETLRRDDQQKLLDMLERTMDSPLIASKSVDITTKKRKERSESVAEGSNAAPAEAAASSSAAAATEGEAGQEQPPKKKQKVAETEGSAAAALQPIDVQEWLAFALPEDSRGFASAYNIFTKHLFDLQFLRRRQLVMNHSWAQKTPVAPAPQDEDPEAAARRAQLLNKFARGRGFKDDGLTAEQRAKKAMSDRIAEKEQELRKDRAAIETKFG